MKKNSSGGDATKKGYHSGGSANSDLRGDTGEPSQRPTKKKESVSSDRGSFKCY